MVGPSSSSLAPTDAKEAVQPRLSESQARRWMKGQGMALRKACPIPGKVDPQLQLVTEKLLPNRAGAGRQA